MSDTSELSGQMAEWVQEFYRLKLYTNDDVKEFVKSKDITVNDYKIITSEDYAAVPGAPKIEAVAKDGAIDFTINPPESDGGSPVIKHKIYCKTRETSDWGTPIEQAAKVLTGTISNLKNGQMYTLKAVEVNIMGDGAESEGIHVTPMAPAQ
ncbi:XkdX family protein [Sporolactobacillus shoreicorticis]|uniref:XkdX family protein n=1 Tax=Sporolactobacillus shoreicorticis TaxID=1923877 RepID=A0ABW5S8U9_9BACL|nr:XkdX family protein [Sporolactobacillus shoreicorticis]MCO7125626.1 XkdX family protein [Sporolactobacillus shoreicorticis]